MSDINVITGAFVLLAVVIAALRARTTGGASLPGSSSPAIDVTPHLPAARARRIR